MFQRSARTLRTVKAYPHLLTIAGSSMENPSYDWRILCVGDLVLVSQAHLMGLQSLAIPAAELPRLIAELESWAVRIAQTGGANG